MEIAFVVASEVLHAVGDDVRRWEVVGSEVMLRTALMGPLLGWISVRDDVLAGRL